MLVARLFIISPLWVAYFFHETYNGPLYEEMDFSTLLIISMVAYLVLAWKDSGRAPRSAISVIMRNMALTYCVVFLALFWGWLVFLVYDFTRHALVHSILAMGRSYNRPSFNLPVC